MYVSIQYRDFYDVPRIFLLRHDGHLLLLDSPFDDDIDEYSASYDVYLMPELPQETLEGPWAHLRELASCQLGCIPVAAVEFDATRRNAIDIGSLEALLTTLHAMTAVPMKAAQPD
jgi:hypothetical protein